MLPSHSSNRPRVTGKQRQLGKEKSRRIKGSQFPIADISIIVPDNRNQLWYIKLQLQLP
ncbi:hypothetical protein MTR_4g094955 [Medicago truncatula]|uniref:Uncharacterized protein n=1 Tax=Medicago truncatula TaxID=3880 RepID=A0A072UR21_MEDTR|nr:hypothetical protein MTR_4g094955 [Medicago truncatula]